MDAAQPHPRRNAYSSRHLVCFQIDQKQTSQPPYHQTSRRKLETEDSQPIRAHLKKTKNSEFLLSQSPLEKAKAESEKAKVKQEDEVYDTLDEIKDIQVEDGFVSYTKHFKYLGSYISYNLCDDYDIDARLAAASASMGAIKKVWDCPHMDLHNKYLLFRAIPFNLLLWGCETWSQRQTLLENWKYFYIVA